MVKIIKILRELNKEELDQLAKDIALTERQTIIYYEKHLKGKSLFDISDKIGVSYSTISHESSLINKKIDKYLNNR